MKLEFSRRIFEKYSNIKFNENPSSGSRVVPCGRTGTTKLIVAFRSSANALKYYCPFEAASPVFVEGVNIVAWYQNHSIPRTVMSFLASLWGDVTDGNSINTAGITIRLLSLTTCILILQKRRNAEANAIFPWIVNLKDGSCQRCQENRHCLF
jgi:hypothetical protein